MYALSLICVTLLAVTFHQTQGLNVTSLNNATSWAKLIPNQSLSQCDLVKYTNPGIDTGTMVGTVRLRIALAHGLSHC